MNEQQTKQERKELQKWYRRIYMRDVHQPSDKLAARACYLQSLRNRGYKTLWDLGSKYRGPALYKIRKATC